MNNYVALFLFVSVRGPPANINPMIKVCKPV